jgi:NTP pyrophosphatase (non-canonical NTP hydrolase)
MSKSLKERQDEARDLLGEELKHPRLGAVLGLSEELGELVKEIMELEIYNKPEFPLDEETRQKISAEVGDVLFSLFEVCTAYGIDLETAYDYKLDKIRSKRDKWLVDLGDKLIQRRKELD